MGALSEWADQQGTYIKVNSGETFKGVYLGYQEGSYKGKPLIEYKFNLDGKEMIFSSSASKLAMQMDRIKIGTLISVKKIGEGTDTVYEVTNLDPSGPENLDPSVPEKEIWDES